MDIQSGIWYTGKNRYPERKIQFRMNWHSVKQESEKHHHVEENVSKVLKENMHFLDEMEHPVNRNLPADISCPNVFISVIKKNHPKSPLWEERKIAKENI